MSRDIGWRRAGTSLAIALGVALATGIPPAHAVETQLWISDAVADYAKAESRGVRIGPEGVLRLGPRAVSSPSDSAAVIWAIAPLPDGSVALACDGGRIDRWTAAGGIRRWKALPVGQVLSLARDGDGLVAGTGPDGLIYRITAKGDTSVMARTGERYVWGLAPAGRGAWFAATGTKGRLLRIEGARSRIVLDSDESNLVSLVSDGKDGAFVGGDSKGKVFHARAGGGVRTVYDAPEDEIRALAIGSDGALYAAGLSASAVSDDAEGDDDKPQPSASPVSGARAIVYRIVPDSVAHPVWTSTQPFVFALAQGPDGMLVATGGRAGVFELTRGGYASQWLAAPEGQVTALVADGKGGAWAASSNPGALWRLGPERAARGELLSNVLDARRFARFGRIRWLGDPSRGRVELDTRSGNGETPDTTWSPWERGSEKDNGFRVVSPGARYLQWRLTLAGGDPRIDAVEVGWREQNLAPRIDDLVVAPQGAAFREGDLTPRSEPVTQTLSGGQRVEYSISTTSQKSLRGLPAWARGLRTLQWRGSDPNGDNLKYRVDVLGEDGQAWIEVGKDLDATSFTWDTNGLPDGRYRVRVIASDAVDNAVGEERTGEASSEPFTVDNTPPAVASLEAQPESGAARIRGRAEDGANPLSRIEVSVDDGDWRILAAEGGVTDERSMGFEARLGELAPGEHTVSVRAVDRAGNTATRAVRVTVPARR